MMKRFPVVVFRDSEQKVQYSYCLLDLSVATDTVGGQDC